MRSLKTVLVVPVVLGACLLSGFSERNWAPEKAARAIAIQHNGRIKSFDSFRPEAEKILASLKFD